MFGPDYSRETRADDPVDSGRVPASSVGECRITNDAHDGLVLGIGFGKIGRDLTSDTTYRDLAARVGCGVRCAHVACSRKTLWVEEAGVQLLTWTSPLADDHLELMSMFVAMDRMLAQDAEPSDRT